MAEGKGPEPIPHCSAGHVLKSRVDQLDKENDEQWAAINTLRNRPPVWATAVISILCFALGAAMTWASLASRLAHVGITASK